MTDIDVFDPAVDVTSALTWPFNKAEALQSLIESKQRWIDENHTKFWMDWQRDVFDLNTANDFGLSVWALILDLPLSFSSQASPSNKIGFGFGQYRKNFNNGNFKRKTAGENPLTTEQARIALKLRYYQLITTGGVLEINAFLISLFGPDYGLAYVRDNLDMTATYIFTFYPPSQLQAVLDNFDILPRPAGVRVNYEIVLADNFWFGFEGGSNFDNGTLFDGAM